MGGTPHFWDISTALSDQHGALFKVLDNYLHSDFRLANLVSWGGKGAISFTNFNGNVIFKFSKYTDNDTFFAFAGDYDIASTVEYICSLSQRLLGRVDIRLIPEAYADEMKSLSNIAIDDDFNQRDYLLSIGELSQLIGRKHAHTRELVHRFERDNGAAAEFEVISNFSGLDYDSLLQIFYGREKSKNNSDFEKELRAMGRLVTYSDDFTVECAVVRVNGIVEAFIFYEIIDSKNVLAHYWRANTDYRGLYQYMLNRLCTNLCARGLVEMNFMQDLGIEGLRSAKEYLRPIGYKKKYVISDWVPAQTKGPRMFGYQQVPESQLLALPC